MKKLLSIITSVTLLLTACSKDDDSVIAIKANGNTTVSFDAVFGSQDFSLNKDFISGTKTYNFNKFRYWISNVILVDSKSQEYKVPNSYFLLEETGAIAVQDGAFTYPATKREDVLLKNVPFGEYKAIKFSVGIDQKYNDNLSLQAGELSQLNGMTNVSWMWMTSYIFSSVGGKISEGTGATLASKAMLVETGLNVNYKTIALDLPQSLHVSSSADAKVVLTVDVERSVDGIDIMSNPIIGASKASIMAAVSANYSSKVFAVKSVN